MAQEIPAHWQIEEQDNDQVFDPAPLLMGSQSDLLYRNSLYSAVQETIEFGPAQIEKARCTWLQGNAREAAAILHSLRGTISSLGARRFAAASLEVEKAIKAKKVECVPNMFTRAQSELQRTVAAAHAWLAQSTALHQENLPTVVIDGLQFENFKRLLQERNMKAFEMYLVLKLAIKSQLTVKQFNLLDEAMKCLDFKHALVQLELINAAKAD